MGCHVWLINDPNQEKSPGARGRMVPDRNHVVRKHCRQERRLYNVDYKKFLEYWVGDVKSEKTLRMANKGGEIQIKMPEKNVRMIDYLIRSGMIEFIE